MNVLLVGNGPSAMEGGHGDEIDAFDGLVVRFNKCVFNDEVGHRIDIWVTWGEQGFFRDIEQSRTLLTMCPRHADEEAKLFVRNHGDNPTVTRITNETDRGVRKYIGHPSSGALATAHFLRDPEVDGVFIYGFDHFSARKHHYWSTVKDEVHGHDPYREALWFNNLIKQGRITRWKPNE
mgnify:CR=1 FL=1